MPTATRYPEISVSGPPLELGRQLGESARSQIRGFCDVALDRVRMTVDISRDRAYEIARQSREFAKHYRPDLVLELQGTAEGAGLSLDDLMMLQVRNQFKPEAAGGCTSVSLTPANGIRSGPLVAQTWDNDPVLDEFTIVLTRHPDGKPAFMSCTQAGLISYMGVSETGIGTCVNTLPAPSRELGVPHYFILREIYEATSLYEVISSMERAHRAIPVNIMLSTPQGPADIEGTVDEINVLRPDRTSEWITHTNHCIHTKLQPINDEFPELADSHRRYDRISQLLTDNAGPLTIDAMKAVLRDHRDYPRSICRHVSDDPVCGFWETVFAIIIEPDHNRMHISRGTPCTHPFEIYDMATV